MKRYSLVIIVVIAIVLILGICFLLRNHLSPQTNETTSNIDKRIMTVYNQKELWQEIVNDGSGVYETGFCFFDMNMDGKKELAVQHGGDETRNCKTKFYQVKKSSLKPCDYFDDDYSISILSLKKYKDAKSNQFYLNQNTIKTGENEYTTSYDKIDKTMKPIHLFAVKQQYQKDTSTCIYYINEKEVEQEKYQQEFEQFMSELTEEEIYTYFVPFTMWDQMSENEQKKALEKSYYVDKNSYVDTLSAQTVKTIDVSNYTPQSITLTDAIYGSSFTGFKEAFKDDISAQLYTDKESFIYIVPFSDMLDNMVFYYQNGKLIAYTREFNGIGGSVTYYFNNDNLVSIDKTQVESDMEFTPEDALSIIIRSESAWNMYGA